MVDVTKSLRSVDFRELMPRIVEAQKASGINSFSNFVRNLVTEALKARGFNE